MKIVIKKKSKVYSESQTCHIQEPGYKCEVCDYVASTEVSLQDHFKSDPDKIFSCRPCHTNFSDKNTVMHHVKVSHAELVLTCKFYKKGICKFGSDTSWYSHSPKTLKCRNCANSYSNKKDLMMHRKQDHIENIGSCKQHKLAGKYKNREKCWYIHEINKSVSESSELNDNQDTKILLKNKSEKISKLKET